MKRRSQSSNGTDIGDVEASLLENGATDELDRYVGDARDQTPTSFAAGPSLRKFLGDGDQVREGGIKNQQGWRVGGGDHPRGLMQQRELVSLREYFRGDQHIGAKDGATTMHRGAGWRRRMSFSRIGLIITLVIGGIISLIDIVVMI